MSADNKIKADQIPHVWLHLFLIIFTIIAIYPVLWVVTVAFSGQQNLAFAELPADPGFLDRFRAILPWPEQWSLKNFTDVLTLSLIHISEPTRLGMLSRMPSSA